MVKFSVVITLYNKENNILKTINSVLSQTYNDFELLIVNDGSIDHSLEVVETVNDKRIRIINKPNGGVSSARNRGIQEASNDWICFLDGDDYWYKNHLENIEQLIKLYPSNSAFCGSFIRSDQGFPKILPQGHEIIEDYFKKAIIKHFFWTSVVVINKHVFEHIGVFNERMSMGEDLDLWARVGKNYKIIQSKEIHAVYVQDSDNKLSFKKVNLDNTIFHHIYFENKKGSERKYFQKLLINKIKHSIKIRDFSTAIDLIVKYNFNLI